MENESVINAKVTSKNVVIEIPKEWILNDFNEMMEGFKVRGNRKNLFLQEVANQIVEYMINEDVLLGIYDDLSGSDNVKYIEDEE